MDTVTTKLFELGRCQTQAHQWSLTLQTKVAETKAENEFEFRTGVRRAFEGDMRLPSLEGVSLKEIRA